MEKGFKYAAKLESQVRKQIHLSGPSATEESWASCSAACSLTGKVESIVGMSPNVAGRSANSCADKLANLQVGQVGESWSFCLADFSAAVCGGGQIVTSSCSWENSASIDMRVCVATVVTTLVQTVEQTRFSVDFHLRKLMIKLMNLHLNLQISWEICWQISQQINIRSSCKTPKLT